MTQQIPLHSLFLAYRESNSIIRTRKQDHEYLSLLEIFPISVFSSILTRDSNENTTSGYNACVLTQSVFRIFVATRICTLPPYKWSFDRKSEKRTIASSLAKHGGRSLASDCRVLPSQDGTLGPPRFPPCRRHPTSCTHAPGNPPSPYLGIASYIHVTIGKS